jgi:hypothetical protein
LELVVVVEEEEEEEEEEKQGDGGVHQIIDGEQARSCEM